MAWWEKKQDQPLHPQPTSPREPERERERERVWTPTPAPQPEKTITEATPKVSNLTGSTQSPTVLGRSVIVKGELTSTEDLLIEGQFDGTVNLQDHCLTIGANGQVKAEIHARQVVIHGTVQGNITAREKVDLRKTGRLQGDLTAAGVAIEDGAYFKGSIEIRREEDAVPTPVPARVHATAAASLSSKSSD